MSDGVTIVADVAGPENGPGVILAHGGGQTRFSWSAAANSLASAGYRTISYDARGHGESNWSPDNRYPIGRRWKDMEEIFRQVPGPCAVVGASMGAGSILYGVQQGFRPAAAVLVDMVPNAERAGMERVRSFMASGTKGFGSLEEVADAVAAYNPDRPRPSDTSGLLKNLRQREDSRYYWHWDPGMLDIDIETEHATLSSTLKVLKELPGLPLLLVRGMSSDVVPEGAARAFRREVPWAEVCDIDQAGHMVAGDRNDVFQEAVISFLGRQLPPV